MRSAFPLANIFGRVPVTRTRDEDGWGSPWKGFHRPEASESSRTKLLGIYITGRRAGCASSREGLILPYMHLSLQHHATAEYRVSCSTCIFCILQPPIRSARHISDCRPRTHSGCDSDSNCDGHLHTRSNCFREPPATFSSPTQLLCSGEPISTPPRASSCCLLPLCPFRIPSSIHWGSLRCRIAPPRWRSDSASVLGQSACIFINKCQPPTTKPTRDQQAGAWGAPPAFVSTCPGPIPRSRGTPWELQTQRSG